MNSQVIMSPIKTITPMNVFSNENYLDESQDTEFKTAIINFIKEFKESKEDESKYIFVFEL